MNGAIEYTLGLATSPFLRGISGAIASLASLAGATVGIGAVMRGIWKSIEEGGALQDLSNRTGESVATLYQLRAAFEEVGGSAESVPQLLLNLQRALGGVDESGRSTGDVFARLGLSVESLKSMDAVQQVDAIVGALAKLSQAEASNLGSKIFGRGFGDIKAAVNDIEGFRQSLRDSAKDAQIVARSAAAFDQIGDTAAKVKRRFGLVFTGMAEALAPVIQSILNSIDAIDFGAIGQRFGEVMSGIVGAWKAGNLGSLIFETITTGMEAAADMAPGIFSSIGAVLLKALTLPLIEAQARIYFLVQRAVDVGRMLAGKPVQLTSYEDAFKETWEEGVKFNYGAGEFGQKDVEDAAKKALAAGAKSVAARFAALADLIAKAGEDVLKTKVTPKKTGGQEEPLAPASRSESPKAEVDSLRRIGFFSGRGNAGLDHARNTAQNTARTVQRLDRIASILEVKEWGGTDFANA